MNSHADKTPENKSKAVADNFVKQQTDSGASFQHVDNRQESIAQRKLQEMADNSPQVKQLQGIQSMANSYAAQLTPQKENKTGLPDNLKSGIESVSGYLMDDVKVHYNSDKPAQLQAHAYAQGTDIHLGSGQEKHLPHEAWHVVQQKQGRVKPTLQMKRKENSGKDSAAGNQPVVQRNAADALKYGAAGLVGGGLVGAGIGAAIGSFVPGIGTAIGAGVGAAIGGFLGGVGGAIKGALMPQAPPPVVPTSAYTHLPFTDIIYAVRRQNVAADLDLDNYHALDEAGKINKLFLRFNARAFVYSMAAGGFDRYAAGNGDCKTLTDAFITIAAQEFGIAVTRGEHPVRFYTGGGATVDGSTGNCNAGANWFFANHYWVNHGGVSYDLLFGAQGINEGNFDDVADTGKLRDTEGNLTDISYWLTAAGVIVWENIPNAAGPNPNKYRSDTSADRHNLIAAGYQAPA